ncbi:MAG: hypothetical protein OSA87_04325 [Woeseiaceae bacterium]|nr:hypothetical protein [Woeseiaceae bacterium]
MRRSASLLIPLSFILMYYGAWIGLAWFLAAMLATLAIQESEYGKTLAGPLLTMLIGRDE